MITKHQLTKQLDYYALQLKLFDRLVISNMHGREVDRQRWYLTKKETGNQGNRI